MMCFPEHLNLSVVIVAGPISLAVQLVFAAAVIIVFWLCHTKSGEATCAQVPEYLGQL